MRTYLESRAAEAGAQQNAAVEAVQALADKQQRLAVEGIARAAETVRQLPRQNQETLGPLYPGKDNF